MHITKRKLEFIIDNVKELRELSLEMPVIVEGKNDERSLRKVGVCGDILKVKTNHSLFEFCELVSHGYKEVILFTDLDSAGKRIGKIVKKYLTDKGVKVNDKIARKLMYALNTSETENVSKRLESVYSKLNYP
jgi:5S rRNA maturation endonuclease (ribonuclease M5)